MHFKKLNSTNQYLIDHADNLSSRSIVQADCQIRGRGKHGRHWISSNLNNLYFSILFKNEASLEKISPYMTMLIAVVIRKIISQYLDSEKYRASIRWPNDIMVNEKKISGILAESSWVGLKINYLILGAGINLNMDLKELSTINQPAIALNQILHTFVEKDIFLQKTLTMFFELYDLTLCHGPSFMLTSFFQYLSETKKQKREWIGHYLQTLGIVDLQEIPSIRSMR